MRMYTSSLFELRRTRDASTLFELRRIKDFKMLRLDLTDPLITTHNS